MDTNKEQLDLPKSLSTSEAAQRLGYKGSANINYLVKTNNFPNAYLENNKWRIPLSDVEKFERAYRFDDCLDTEQVAIRLGYKSSASINQLIKRSIFPNAFKFNQRWWVPVGEVEAIERIRLEALDTKQVAERLNIKSNIQVAEMIRKKIFPNAFKDVLGVLRVPLKDIKSAKDAKENLEISKQKNRDESLNLAETAEEFGYKTKGSVRKYLNQNCFPNAYKQDREWRIPLSDIENFKIKQQEKKEEKQKTLPIKCSRDITNCLNTNEVKNDLDTYKKQLHQQEKIFKNTLSVTEAANRLGYTNKGTLHPMITKHKKFPNAFKFGGSWRIPVSDIEEFERGFTEKKRKIDYTAVMAYSELSEFINTIDISDKLYETRNLFLQYCLLQVNNMSGSTRYKRDRVLLYKRLYKSLFDVISDEIFMITSKEISKILSGKSSLRKDERKVLIPFLRYVYNKKDIETDQQFSLTSLGSKDTEKEIYSPELFHEIYQHVKKERFHTLPALQNRYYANMWVYTILLLTDFIRGQDLIMNTPEIDLKVIDANSFDWLPERAISDSQAQAVINQLYMHFRYKRSSKTDELLTFIVAPDLIVPLATALIISELHRRIDGSKVQLDTFLEGKFNKIRTSGKTKHKRFFNGMNNNFEFKFSSLKMNRSVATYLFYSVTEDDGYDSELALHLTQVSRSHKKSDTTSTYIQATNKDGTINRVSYNLFKRGHFGWLYNYLILYVSQFKGTSDTLEQRSNLIEQVRKEISPLDLESAAKFVNSSLTLMPLNENAKSMEVFLKSIYQKRQTVISKLKDYSKEEIKEIIMKLSNGDLPSKTEHAQCLVGPICKRPKLKNCFSCEYVIPGNLMLIQLNEELNRLIKNIESTTSEVILQRESKFLLHALFIWKEARMEFGDSRVNAYISAEEKWNEIEKVAYKLIMD